MKSEERQTHERGINSVSDLHGAPWLDKDLGEVHVVGRLSDSLSVAAGLVAVEQTPAAGSEVAQHARRSICLQPRN